MVVKSSDEISSESSSINVSLLQGLQGWSSTFWRWRTYQICEPGNIFGQILPYTVNTVTPFTWGREELQAWDDVEGDEEDEEEDEEGVVEDGGKALGDGSLFDDALVHGDMVPHSTLVLDGNTSCGRLVPDSEALNGVLDNSDTPVLGNGALVHTGGQISVCNANPRVSTQHRRWV